MIDANCAVEDVLGEEILGMAWTEPVYGRAEYDQAAMVLAAEEVLDLDEYLDSLTIVNQWRSAHGLPLQVIKMWLKGVAKATQQTALVAQRIKRITSIEAKIRRFPHLTLTKMLDVGGCRAIVSSAARLDRLFARLRQTRANHECYKVDDYVRNPKADGYRSIHLKYKYHTNNKKLVPFDGLRIEMQIRSVLQHQWATAVEIVDFHTGEGLKFGRGDPRWARFFVLVGSLFAVDEKRARVPDTPALRQDIVKELRSLDGELDAISRLNVYRENVRSVENVRKSAHYFLIALNPSKKEVTTTGFRIDEGELANKRYNEAEKDKKLDVVLVSVDKWQALHRAYPNYFLDASAFANKLATELAKA